MININIIILNFIILNKLLSLIMIDFNKIYKSNIIT